MASTSDDISKKKRKDFEAVFPSLVEDLMQRCKQYKMPKDALDWFQNVGDDHFATSAGSPDIEFSHSL